MSECILMSKKGTKLGVPMQVADEVAATVALYVPAAQPRAITRKKGKKISESVLCPLSGRTGAAARYRPTPGTSTTV
jgi:hypothetical protein